MQRLCRYLMLWSFVALQAMAPFIHAHAGAVRYEHAGFMHVHQPAGVEVARHGVASDAHGTEVSVAPGALLRHALAAAQAEQPAFAPPPPRPVPEGPLALGEPRAPPLPPVAPPAHARPHALAPPVA